MSNRIPIVQFEVYRVTKKSLSLNENFFILLVRFITQFVSCIFSIFVTYSKEAIFTEMTHIKQRDKSIRLYF